ncbi:TIGR04290 family methyltransferase [Roseivivax isoporae]|uniref:SAM-dependent methyltransferase n=1 Tax=Roseivivax isoporae LMG 25204 TaxID=1449351 RepID=X7F8A8_9RHOB|nr:TIGR04290 family methyltransferase [Roseivivax isoporae]ETX29005.1 SAM-dependent methyltransferase [Roseivivax isoporae LMG 25204]
MSVAARHHRPLADRIAELGPWFQNLRLDGIETAPDHPLGDHPRAKWEGFAHVLPDDLQGASVLDIGCNAGFFGFEALARNAGEVVGIDTDSRYLDQARLAAEVKGIGEDRLTFRRLDVYEVGRLERRFDLVIFMGVLYHLRHPLLALDLLYQHAVGDRMLFQSLQRGAPGVFRPAENLPFDETEVFDRPDWPKLHVVERRYADDPTNWFIPNASASAALLGASGFDILERPAEDVWLCRRGQRPWGVTPLPCGL